MKLFDFDVLKKNMDKIKEEMPVILANQAKNYFVGTFSKSEFGGQQWKEVKRRIPGTSEYKYPKTKQLSRRTSPILVRTGTLRRAVSTSQRSATWDSIRFAVELPYAEYLNEGTDKMDKREFMGTNPELESMQQKKIESYIDKLFGI